MRRIAILLTALALFAAACGDDDGGVLGSAATTEAPGTTADGGATTTDGGTDATTTTSGGGTASGAGDVQAALDAYQDAVFRVTYLFGSGDDEQIIILSQDPGQDPPVFATLIGTDGEEGKFLTIGDQTLICGAPGEECIGFPDDSGVNMGQAMLGPMLSSLLTIEDFTSTPGFSVDQDSTTIGGRSGVCFTYTPTALAVGADVAYVRQCVDSEMGFILLFEGQEAGADEPERIMELVEFGAPRPEDFEPTGPVTTMPGG
ncbi:MAG: hypothetical protein KQH83_04895 [Actinobacteria bacterium]|nr:hypothetical protein [Actinomycetota bacterium]